MNETICEFVNNMIFSNIDTWLIFVGIIVFISIGLLITRNSALNFLKTLFNKFFIIIIVSFSLYIVIVLYFLGYTPFYNFFRFSDIIGLIICDFGLCLFESYKLTYEKKYTFKILNKLLISSLFVYALDIFRVILSPPQKIEIFSILYNISSDMALIILIGTAIFPFMYLIAVINEYYQINSFIEIKKLKIDIKSIFFEYKFHLNELFEFKKKVEACEDESIESLDSNLFELKDDKIFKMGKEIGNYIFCNEMPKLKPDKVTYAKTKYKKFSYIINFDEGDDEEINYVYVPIDNLIIKLCLKSETVPLKYQSDLVEFIHDTIN